MKPQSIVLMHIPGNQLSSVKQKVSKLDKSYPPVFVFNASMEKITVTDIAVISNHQPVALGEMADTTCYTNTPVNIHIPFLFEDPDLNDSLTYSATGLPAGISFNTMDMILTGSSENTGTSTIKITTTDKSLCSNSLTFNMTLSKPSSVFEKRLPGLCVYPVPSANYLWLDQPISPGLKIQIVDLQGKIFKDEFIKANPIDISGLSKGTYILHVTGSGEITDQRIVKE
jgi:hypothetical protein